MSKSRASDSPYILGVNHHIYAANEANVTVPDGCWDIVVIKQDGQTQVLLTGAITGPIPLDFPPGTEVMNITFRPDLFHTIPGPKMLNVGKVLPMFGQHSFVFDNMVLEIPTFDNAEQFLDKMFRAGILQSDKLVASYIEGKPLAASDRSVQRHFLQTTGMTMKFMQQTERAQLAVDMLKQGVRIADVAHTLGFTDQAHMTRSLKGIMGVTPSVIANTK